MNTTNKEKLLVSILITFISSLLITGVAQAEKREAGGRPEAQEKAGAEQAEFQQYKNKVMELKNKRDTDLAALIKQRDGQIQALQDAMRQMTQADVAKIKKDKAYIQQKMTQGQNMKDQQKALLQEEQALMQKSSTLQQQIIKLKNTYDQQIQKVTQAYAQMFANLQKEMPTQQ